MTDSENSSNNTNNSVQDKLLNAAEILFCEKGFEGTSIRDIASSAGCNIASVNYYFGGKQQLYEQVWKRHLIPMRNSRLESIEKILLLNDNKPELEELIKSFAESFIGKVVDPEKENRFNKLMAREYINKHLPANMFLEEIMMPTVTAMQNALIQAFPEIDKQKVLFIVFSLIGQLVHVVHVRAMFENDIDNLAQKLFNFDEIVNHIVEFTCAGIRFYMKEKKV